jgi:hypothetical protein
MKELNSIGQVPDLLKLCIHRPIIIEQLSDLKKKPKEQNLNLEK